MPRRLPTTVPFGTKAASIQRLDCQITMKSKSRVRVFLDVLGRGGRQKVKSSENVDTKEQCVSMCCCRQLSLPIEFHLSPTLFLLFSLRIHSVFAGDYVSFSSPSLDWPSAVDIMEATSDATATSQQEPQAQRRRPIRAVRRAAGRVLGVIPRLMHLSF